MRRIARVGHVGGWKRCRVYGNRDAIIEIGIGTGDFVHRRRQEKLFDIFKQLDSLRPNMFGRNKSLAWIIVD